MNPKKVKQNIKARREINEAENKYIMERINKAES